MKTVYTAVAISKISLEAARATHFNERFNSLEK